MNAMLTWWGVSLAVAGHETFGAQVSRTSHTPDPGRTDLRCAAGLADPRSDYRHILCRWTNHF